MKTLRISIINSIAGNLLGNACRLYRAEVGPGPYGVVEFYNWRTKKLNYPPKGRVSIIRFGLSSSIICLETQSLASNWLLGLSGFQWIVFQLCLKNSNCSKRAGLTASWHSSSIPWWTCCDSQGSEASKVAWRWAPLCTSNCHCCYCCRIPRMGRHLTLCFIWFGEAQ